MLHSEDRKRYDLKASQRLKKYEVWTESSRHNISKAGQTNLRHFLNLRCGDCTPGILLPGDRYPGVPCLSLTAGPCSGTHPAVAHALPPLDASPLARLVCSLRPRALATMSWSPSQTYRWDTTNVGGRSIPVSPEARRETWN